MNNLFINPKILVSGKFKPDDLIISVNESNRKIDPVIENKIEGLWSIKEKYAKEKDLRLYNEISYRLNSINNRKDKVYLELGKIDFKTSECLIQVSEYFNLDDEYYRKGCHTLATVKTNDDKYILVELSGKSMNTNPFDFIGGVIETEPEIKNGDDMFESLYRELEEEAFITKNDIKECYLKLIYLSYKTSIGFYFEVKLNISSEKLLERFEKSKKDIDIKSLKILSRIDYINKLENHNTNKKFISSQIKI